MKKRLLTFLFLGSFVFQSSACEICGCGVGNYYFGLLPQFRSHFIGFRYQFNKFNTRLSDDPTQFSRDFFQTIELWGGWNIGKRFQVLAILPVNFNHQVSDEGTSNTKGLGDVMALLNYKLFDLNSTKQIWIGAGIKLPTGKFDIDPADPDVASKANNQLGSGSTDFFLNATYNLRVKKWGLSTQALYKINSTNKDKYRFGNKFSASSFVSYTIDTKSITILPNAGLLYERSGKSSLQSKKIGLTGGSLLQGSVGAEFGIKKIAIGFNIQLPLAQDFAENQTKQQLKGMLHVSFSF